MAENDRLWARHENRNPEATESDRSRPQNRILTQIGSIQYQLTHELDSRGRIMRPLKIDSRIRQGRPEDVNKRARRPDMLMRVNA